MKIDFDLLLCNLFFIFIFWISFSFFGSLVKSKEVACDKKYYVDYVLFTKLFCEVAE